MSESVRQHIHAQIAPAESSLHMLGSYSPYEFGLTKIQSVAGAPFASSLWNMSLSATSESRFQARRVPPVPSGSTIGSALCGTFSTAAGDLPPGAIAEGSGSAVLAAAADGGAPGVNGAPPVMR